MPDLVNQDKGETKITDGVRDLVINADGSINTVGSTGGGSPTPALLTSQNKVYHITSEVSFGGNPAEFEYILVDNPSLSGKRFILLDIVAGISEDVNSHFTVRVYYSPTITGNGVAITPVPARVGGTQPVSAMNVFELPTASAFGSRIFNKHSVGGSSGGSTSVTDKHQTSIVEPGNKFLITLFPDQKNRIVELSMMWAEETV